MGNAVGRSRLQQRRALFALVTVALMACVPFVAPQQASAATTTQLRATPTALDFGDVQVGVTAPAQQVQVTNAGSAAVKLSGSYGASGPFSSSGNCKGATLAKGGTCHLTITFAPKSTGAVNATVVDTFNGVKVSTVVTGTGYARVLISPTSLDFGAVALGDTSVPQDITITNLTSSPMTMTGAGGNTDVFNGTQDCQSETIAPGASCHQTYTFTPTALGSVNAVGIGTWNGQGYKITLHGIGVPEFQVTPTALDFGNQQYETESAPQSVTITNRSATAVNFQTVSQAETPFVESSTTCTGALSPGASCAVSYTFTPLSNGTLTETAPLHMVKTGGQILQTTGISFAGVGGASPPPQQFLITPTSLDFGANPSGDISQGQSVTITNRGLTSVLMHGTQGLAGGFRATQACEKHRLAPGASCHMTYQIDSSTLGTTTGTATGRWNGQSFSIALTGYTTPHFLITPLGLEFGPSRFEHTPSQTVTLTNEGSPIAIAGFGAETNDFLSSTECNGLTLGPQASCTAGYFFDPQSRGRRNETAAGTVSGQSYSISLGGLELADLLITPTGLQFAPRAVGTQSAAQTVVVRNVSGQTVGLTGNTTTPANFASTTSCGQTLAAAASCTYSVTFRPTSTGAKQGVLMTTFSIRPNQTRCLCSTSQVMQVTLAGKGT